MNPCPVLVGRQQELATLRSLLEAGGGVALISGEAGIGKSRLVREFAAEAEKAGRVVLWARPEEVAQPGPYALVIDLLESIAERGSKQTATDARHLIGDFLQPTEADSQRPAPAPRSIAAEIRGFLSQLGTPPLVVLEDLHGADESSHAVTLHLARAALDDRHVVIATMRTEGIGVTPSLGRFLDALARERAAAQITLNPMSRLETAEMMESLWNRQPTESELDGLERLGGGVPFFVEELAASEKRQGSAGIPRSVEDSVLHRVHSLGEEGTRVLSAASLLQGAIDPSVVAAALGGPEDQVVELLLQATKAGLLIEEQGRLTFRHALVREAIRASILSIQAKKFHAALAQSLEAQHASDLALFATQIARHYAQADSRTLALPFWLLAGERALALAATEDARAAFQEVLDAGGMESSQALLGLGEVELREGHEATAAEYFRKAATALTVVDPPRAARALSRLAWALHSRVQPIEVLKVIDEALALLESDAKSVDYVRLLVQKGSMLCFLFNRSGEAQPILSQALDAAESGVDEALIAETLDGLAQVADLEGHGEEALVLGARALTAAINSDIPEVVGRTHNNHAVKLATMGHTQKALVVLAEGREWLQRSYGRAAVGALDVTYGWVTWLMGLPGEVTGLAARGRVVWHRWRGYRWLLEVWAALQRGDTERAEVTLSEAWGDLGFETRSRALNDPKQIDTTTCHVLFAETLIRLEQGRGDEAVELSAAVLQFSEAGLEPFDYGQALVLRARSLIAVGKPRDVGLLVERLTDLHEKHAYPYIRASTLELEGTLAGQDSDHSESRRFLAAAATEFSNCANAADQARCERLLAQAMLRTESGSVEDAISALKRARQLAVSSEAVLELNRTDSELRHLGVRPRAGRPRRDTSETAQGLSPREAEVAVLVAAGESNAGIASKLYLSERTVQDHITHALRKLSLSGRAGLASWAVRQGMI